MKTITVAIALLSISGLTDCARAVPVSAAYCSTIAAHHSESRSEELLLTKLLEKFTQANGFQIQGGQQVDTNEYANLSKKMLIELTYGMGEFGSVITVYYRGHGGDNIRNSLDVYLRKNINPTFKVTKCSDIPGFETPRLTDVPY